MFEDGYTRGGHRSVANLATDQFTQDAQPESALHRSSYRKYLQVFTATNGPGWTARERVFGSRMPSPAVSGVVWAAAHSVSLVNRHHPVNRLDGLGLLAEREWLKPCVERSSCACQADVLELEVLFHAVVNPLGPNLLHSDQRSERLTYERPRG